MKPIGSYGLVTVNGKVILKALNLRCWTTRTPRERRFQIQDSCGVLRTPAQSYRYLEQPFRPAELVP